MICCYWKVAAAKVAPTRSGLIFCFASGAGISILPDRFSQVCLKPLLLLLQAALSQAREKSSQQAAYFKQCVLGLWVHTAGLHLSQEVRMCVRDTPDYCLGWI